MRFLVVIAPLLAVVGARTLDTRQIALDTWINTEEGIARVGLFRNIGNRGEFARNVDVGAVIASPSTSSPDYYYQWTRDSALVFKVLLNSYLNGNSSLDTYLREFVTNTIKLQKTDNPSGGYSTGGIGEPKYYVNGAPYTGGWGRPQTDGGALRSIVLMKFASLLLDAGETAFVRTLYDGAYPTNSPIKADLEYTANYWRTNGFDLWEEVTGQHFFTAMVQHRALREGAEFATRMGDAGAAAWYRQQADAIRATLSSFWSSSKGFLVASVPSDRSGQDCGTLLGSIHGNGAKGYGVYPPSSDEILVTLQALVDVMKPLYPINSQSGYPGIAVGRYPSDVYDGVGTSVAHPWFLCTLATAEILYTATNEFSAAGSIKISSLSQSFYRRFYSSASAGSTYVKGSNEYNTIMSGMKAYGDTFVQVVQRHAMTNGSLSEQFSRYDGFQKGARDLTWSYASFLTMKWARDGQTAY